MKKILSLAVVLMFTASVFANTNTGKKNSEKAKTHSAAQDKDKGKEKGKGETKAKSEPKSKGDAKGKTAETKPKKQ